VSDGQDTYCSEICQVYRDLQKRPSLVMTFGLCLTKAVKHRQRE